MWNTPWSNIIYILWYPQCVKVWKDLVERYFIIRKPKVWRTNERTWGSLYTPPTLIERGYKNYQRYESGLYCLHFLAVWTKYETFYFQIFCIKKIKCTHQSKTIISWVIMILLSHDTRSIQCIYHTLQTRCFILFKYINCYLCYNLKLSRSNIEIIT